MYNGGRVRKATWPVSYKIHLTRQAEKDLHRLDKATERRVLARLKELAPNPYDRRISKMVIMSETERASRVGKWRIVYEIDETNRTLEILSIDPRERAYSF
ncbi:MAG: type II toxin-antitoxin system RelE/ParE family toxin [Deltaproteobacteria bacterium]|nr:type II toxin-antitoxin system RelE/ParE family toxin [Deltaproteobacteria bacterium]